jgi:hypothetical protein
MRLEPSGMFVLFLPFFTYINEYLKVVYLQRLARQGREMRAGDRRGLEKPGMFFLFLFSSFLL